jgi:hypothetical protein
MSLAGFKPSPFAFFPLQNAKEQAPERRAMHTLPYFDGNDTNKMQKIFNASPLFPPNFNRPDGLFSRRGRGERRAEVGIM